MVPELMKEQLRRRGLSLVSHKQLEGQLTAILELPHISGYCYTQLTDVEQGQTPGT